MGWDQEIMNKKIGESIVVPWEQLPEPRPKKGAVMGNDKIHFYCICEPTDAGLEMKRVGRLEALEYRKKCEQHWEKET